VVNDAIAIGEPPDLETKAALRKNRAWAELQLGFLEPAEADANLSVSADASSAASYCLLGKIYTKSGRLADAEKAWKAFSKLITSDTSLAKHPMVEPDCTILAQGGSHESK
jgi:hypothetical protein